MPVKPFVSRKWLFFLAGALWFAAGFNLCLLAYRWLHGPWKYLFWLALAVSSLVSYFGLRRIAHRNVRFIKKRPDKTCLFAFQPWRSYLIIIVMVAMGLSLRHSSFPRHWLGLIYTVMGGALAVASFSYFREGLTHLKTEVNAESNPG